jgi:protein-export membrane protein SecD/preprotein translocase SecF subunit
MWDFLKRWHPILLILFGIYLAIPKPGPNPAEVDEEFLAEYDKNDNGVIDKEEFTGGTADFALRDRNDDKVLTVGSKFRFPLHDYKWNLGQDLKGGSSLRYVLVQQDMDEAEAKIRELLEPLKEELPRLTPEARAKFGDIIQGAALTTDVWTTEDFNLLNDIPGLFDEDRADALRRYYDIWNSAKKRKEDKDLVGPTIETLNRRLNATGITELNISPLGENRIEVKLPEFSTGAETERYKQLLETTGKLEMRVLADEDGDFAKLNVNEYPKDEGYKFRWLELARDEVSSSLVKESNGRKYVPVQIIDDYEISGRNLDNIQPTTDRQGRMAVSFDLKGLAVARFEALTAKHKKAGEDPRLLAIVIDGKVYSAYTIEDTISGSVQLSGNFSTQERDDIINVLKSGSLNVKLELEGEESVGPSEGAESVQRGIWSFVIAAIFVFLFALWLYRGLGILVIFNLLTIIVLIMGAMALGLGTLTMPGIAGLVLTFGMAIDGNILINERMREELAKGLPQRAAAEEGFKNAFSAIVDSNITTLLTALILYKVGSGPVQGFALTVAIGICATLYANIPAYRAMIMGVLNIKRDVRFSMQSLKWLENRNINFVAGMKIAVPIAVIVSIAGIALLFSLGSSVLGMEFRGGYAFRAQMNKGYEREQIEEVLIDSETGDPRYEWAEGVEIQPVYRFRGGPEEGGADRYDFRFPMRTEWESGDPEQIKDMLHDELEKAYAEHMVADGWVATAKDVRQVTLRARLTLKLKEPEKFREENPDDYDQLWLAHDIAWKDDINAPRTNRAKWFGTLTTADDDVHGSFVNNAAGDRQIYTLDLRNVTVLNDAELAQKRREFADAINRNFLADSRTVTADGAPVFEYFATQAALSVHVTLLEAVSVKDFTEAVQSVQNTALASTTLKVSPVNPDAETAREFEISSEGPMTFSADPDDPGHFNQVQGAINETISAWLKNAEPEGNEISKRFLLSSAIGATVAAEMQWRALFAIIAALVVLVIYMRIRFASAAWGFAAIIALSFVVTVTIAALGVADALGADMKIDLVIVAGILTVIGYAINDTIVNFDRIRESLKKDRLATGGTTPLKVIVNQSANLMLPRTLMTGGTTLTSALIMIIFGGPLLAAFSFTIFVGVVMGTFASVFIASPVLLLLDRSGKGDLLDMTAEEAEREAEEARRKTEENADEDAQPEEEEPEAEEKKEEAEEKTDEPEEKKDEGKKD